MYRKLLSNEFSISGANIGSATECHRLFGVNEEEINQVAYSRRFDAAGVKYHFFTTSEKMKIEYETKSLCLYNHATYNLINGIDIYGRFQEEYTYIKTISPGENEIVLGDGPKEVLVICPPYAQVKRLDMYVVENSMTNVLNTFKFDKPIVFYGSSITQGCAASRPGLSFPEIVSRKLQAEILNFGFSGGAQGEEVIADYLGEINALAYVIEYDHNAETIEQLENTHYAFVKKIFDKNPTAFIIVMSRFSGGISISLDETERRCSIIRNSVKALNSERVCFIDGSETIPNNVPREMLFADGKHPNDLGMYYIANCILDKLKEYGIK